MSNIIRDTPFEKYPIGNRQVWVKREDLCVDETHFSKMRGVYKHLSSRPEHFIGVLDSYHSKAGWGVSHICKMIGKKAVVFYPQYTKEPGLRDNQVNCLRWDAILFPLQAGRSCILYHRAKSLLAEKYPESYMLPNALKLQESVDDTSDQVYNHTPGELIHGATWIISISSGTIGAGVIDGLRRLKANVNIILHMGYSRSKDGVLNYISKYVGDVSDINLVDEGYGYKDAVENSDISFPCNQYYDAKAWRWLVNNISRLKGKIVFWNIGE